MWFATTDKRADFPAWCAPRSASLSGWFVVPLNTFLRGVDIVVWLLLFVLLHSQEHMNITHHSPCLVSRLCVITLKTVLMPVKLFFFPGLQSSVFSTAPFRANEPPALRTCTARKMPTRSGECQHRQYPALPSRQPIRFPQIPPTRPVFGVLIEQTDERAVDRAQRSRVQRRIVSLARIYHHLQRTVEIMHHRRREIQQQSQQYQHCH